MISIKTNAYIKTLEKMIDDLEERIYNIQDRDQFKGQAALVKPLQAKLDAYIEVWAEMQKTLKTEGTIQNV